MTLVRYVPLIVAIILASSVAIYATAIVPPATTPTHITLRVGYPDSLDESDVPDIWAYQHILAPEGITVIPTFYDDPALSYKSLITGQSDIAYAGNTLLFDGLLLGVQATCLTSYALSSGFSIITNGGISNLHQLIGKWVEDSGPGTGTRAQILYQLATNGIPYSETGVYNASAVNFRTGVGNVARVHDLLSNATQGISVDTFIVSDFSSPSENTTANGGPFHVFPELLIPDCIATTDAWLQKPGNYQIAVEFIAALTEAARYFISNPQFALHYEEQQLPETSPQEIQFAVNYYPTNYIYFPWGEFNLVGPLVNETALFHTVNNYLLTTNLETGAVVNSSVHPYGVWNKYIELKALQSLPKYYFPCSLYPGYVTSSFIQFVKESVPPSLGGLDSTCPSS